METVLATGTEVTATAVQLDVPTAAIDEATTRAAVPEAEPRARSYRRRLVRYLAFDGAALSFAGGALSLAGAGHVPFLVSASLAAVFGLRLGNLYQRDEQRSAPAILDQATAVLMATSLGGLAGAAAWQQPTRWAAAWAGLACLSLLLSRSVAYRGERAHAIANPRRVLIVGSSSGAQELAERLLRHPEHGMVPVGFVDTNPDPVDPELPMGVTGSLEDLAPVARRLRVERVIVDTSSVREDELMAVLDQAARSQLEIVVLPALAGHLSTAISIESIAGMTLLAYRQGLRRGVSWFAKRAVDIVAAAAGLILTTPIWLIAALAVKTDSAGPVFFRQVRVGRDGRLFTLYKFRSMTVDAEDSLIDLRDRNEADGPYFKVAADPRITRIGRWLRRYSVDELPQLLNVLRGDMSLVGPRPPLPGEVAEYPDWFRRRLTVPPGMTGLWQVSGRFLLPFHEAARLDVFYVDHWSFGLDLKILLRTPLVVLSGRGAR